MDGGGSRGVIMTPAGISENVEKLIAPTGGCPGVAEHLHPFVEGDANGVVGADVLGEAETRGIGGIFRLEAAEELVPDDEGAAMVAVDVARVRTVMHAVMRRRVQNFFERPHGANEFRMNPELVEEADRLHGHDHHRRKTDDGQPDPEHKAGEGAGPRLPQRGRQVVALRRMMHDVRCPEETAFVADAVEPVVAEFIAEKEQDPGPRLKADREKRETMQPGQDGELYGLGEQVDEYISEAHGDAGGGIL